MRDTAHRNTTNGVRRAGLWCLTTLLAAWILAYPIYPAYAADDFEEEIKMGKEAAEQVAKESKFIDDAKLVERIEKIGNAIAKVAKEKEVRATYGKSTIADFDYSFKVIDDKYVNAFALPGGFVYVNKGLMDYVQSDDELAGVIAHEIAHVSHHHAVQLLKAQRKEMTMLQLAVLVGAVAGAKTGDLGRLIQVVNLIRIAKLSSYGQDAESDADRTAVAYLAETKHNPVGMLTFMERLARDEIRKPQVDFGIFATHPPAHQRAREIIDEIEKRGIPINRRLVTTYTRVYIKPVPDSSASAVWIADTEIIRLADSGGETSAIRAERIAGKLSRVLLAGARLHDVKIGGGNQYVVVMGEVLVAPTAEDAALAGRSVAEVVTSASDAIKRSLLKEVLEQQY